LIDPALRAALSDIVGAGQVLVEPADVWPYGYDNSRRHFPPDAVVFPQSHDQVARVVQLCNAHGVAMVARGRGTGTVGASVPLKGGVVLAMERMARIVKIDPANRVAVVEPGVTNQDLQDALAPHGFFWPPDPTSAAYCTIGGNLAYNSAGPRAIKYGTPRENTLGLRAVTGGGTEIRTGVYTTKGVVGYDFTRLLIGSEGTLAVVTEATLKLTPLPQAKRTLRATYRDIRGAAAAVSRLMAQPVTPYVLEFIDGNAIEMIRKYSAAPLPENAGAMLIIEVDGLSAGLDAAVDALLAAAQGPGLVDVTAARTPQEVEALWATRKALSPALRNVAPKKINEDVVVPVANLPDLIDGLDALARRFEIRIINFGHAGNGNIHVNLLVDPDQPDQLSRAEHCLDEVFSLVLKLNGTLSGEHGVGIEKRPFIARELTPETMQLMKQVKRLFDPAGLLNPDKIFPD
jgi:D-lactate dehydrogenase